MPLRKPPTRTPEFLAANRRNAKKSTGPRTHEGKAVAALNALKHGGYALQLPEILRSAGHQGSAELYHRVRGEITETFAAGQALGERQVDQLAAQVWLMARQAGVLGRKPESLLLPSTSGRSNKPPFRIRMQVPGGRTALVYWVQKRKKGTKAGSLQGGEAPGEPPVRVEMESKLRRRIVRPATRTRRAESDGDHESGPRPAATPDHGPAGAIPTNPNPGRPARQ